MRITLNQEEIEEAIEKLILDQVDVPDDMRIDIDLKATRGDEGYTAEIDILPHDAPTDGTDRSVDPRINVADGAEGMSIADKTEEAIIEASKPRRRGRPAGARNKPKPHRREPDIEEDVQEEVLDSDGGTDEGPNVENTESEPENIEETSDITEESEESDPEPDHRPVEDVEAEAGEAPIPVQEEPASDVSDADPESNQDQDMVEEEDELVPPPATTTPTRSLFANVQRRDDAN